MKTKLWNAITVFLILAIGIAAIATPVAAKTVFSGAGNCLPGGGDAKLNGPAPVTLTAPAGKIITQVVVKAGSAQSAGDPCHPFTSDGTDGCYTVAGIGTSTVTVTGGGTSSTCKTISHVEFVFGDEPPPPNLDASATAIPDPGCVQPGATKTVLVEVSHASLTINGQTFTSDGSLELGAGSYPWTATADSGYTLTTASSGTVVIIECRVQEASVSVSTPDGCIQNGTTKHITFNVNHATLTLNGVTYTSDGSVDLGEGIYNWSAVADEGYTLTGTTSGSFSVTICEEMSASASATPDPGCVQPGATKTVLVEVSHASLTINGQTFTSDGSLELGAGSYPWTATADSGYTLTTASSGTVVITECTPEPQPGSASISLGDCKIDPATNILMTEVTIKVNNAVVHINGQDITEETILLLPPGDYPWSWEAIEGFTESDSGTLSITATCLPQYKPKWVCTIPGCGGHQEEKPLAPDDVTVIHYSEGNCKCTPKGLVYDDLRARLFSIHPFSILVSSSEKELIKANEEIAQWNKEVDEGTRKGVHEMPIQYHVDTNKWGVKLVYVDATQFKGLDQTYYKIDASKAYIKSGNWPIYLPDGRLYAEVYGLKSVTQSVYIACSISFGPWDITKDSVAIRPLGTTSWEVTWWLWNNGYAPHTASGWLELDKWTDNFWLLASGQAPLPPKP